MTIVGMSYTTHGNGEESTTIYVTDDFNEYYKNTEAGRGCIGKKVDSIYVGNYDCANLKVGMEIDVLYDKAVTTSKGTFQSIKRIDVLSK